NDQIQQQIGKPPANAECLPLEAEPVEQFFASLHCYCQLNGKAQENWPRAGLEAMAAGVPIVVEARGGWVEMIEHRRTGFCCGSDAELAHALAILAWDDDLRQEMARRAWVRLVAKLSEPEAIFAGWRRIFEGLAHG
ncbi:MAG TPA: glycosyltransferase, partial [Phycisphaerae bacterium]|nr:glycosyltransferase [Phycisphaerae bacterium]